MNPMHGFSLPEVLVSLLLICGTSLALLTQQWHVSQLFNQARVHLEARVRVDNLLECATSPSTR